MNRKLRVEELNRKSIQEFKQSAKFPIILVLENIRSLNNIGSIFRTADALGIEEIILVGFTAKPPHRDINKTAIGATESVNWSYYASMNEVFERLKKEEYSVIAVEQTENSEAIQEMDWSDIQRIALILGNELVGVEQLSLDLCVKSIEVPQFGTKHSLNVSVCAGLVVWHIINTKFIHNRPI